MINVIDDKTTKEELLAEYKNYPVTGGQNLLEEKPFYEARLAPIFFEVPMGSKVLDVGANDGSMMEMLQKKRECEVYGVDISETAIAEAAKRGIKVEFADAHKLPYEDQAFDVVILSEVISHVQNPDEVLAEIRRVLKKNGILLGSAPHANLQRFAWEDKRMIRQYYDVDQLHQVLQKHFERSWLRVLNGAQFAVSMKGSFLANEPAEMLFKAGSDSVQGWDAALQDRSILRVWMGFTQGPGVVYYRMSGFADKMQKLGAEIHYDPYQEDDFNSTSGWCQKVRYLPSENRFTNQHIVHQLESLLKASDFSIFQVTSSRDILLLLTTARKGAVKKPIYTEMDDWIFDMTSYNSASGAYRPNSEAEKVAYDQLKLSDGFIVSTEYLKSKLSELCPGKPIYVIKNSLDFDIWDKVQIPTQAHTENPNLVRITYSGCQNHSGDIEIIKRPLMALLDEFPDLEFVSLPHKSTDDIKNPRYKRINQWVPLSIFPQSYAGWETDIAIAPLRDHELNRAKSNLRWLESSALKIPMIASNIEPFKKSISHKKDGILVSNSEKDWYEAMKALIVEKRERTRMGEAAYAKVKKDYNMDKVSKTYKSVLQTIKDDLIRHMGGSRKTSKRSI